MLKILKGEPAAVQSLVFCVVLPRSLFVIVVSVLPFTGFDYPFGVFKLFFKRDRQHKDQMKKRDKKTKMVDKTINRKQRLEQYFFVFPFVLTITTF
jgi:hypothetical protein